MKSKLILFILIITLSGCNRQGILPDSFPIHPSETVELPGSELATAVTPTSRSATITPLPTRMLPTSNPPYDPPPDWVLQADANLGFAMKIPNDWESHEPQSWVGSNGELHYSVRDNHSVGINALCQLEVNNNQKIGSQPTIQLWNNNNGFYGCEILPSSDAVDPNAILLAWYPYMLDIDFILQVNLTPRFVNPIKNGLQSWGSNTTVTPIAEQSPSQTSDFQVTEFSGLRFEEYWVTSQEWYQKHDVEAFASRLPKEAIERKGEIQNNWKQQIPFINQKLAQFDIKITGCTQKVCDTPTIEFGENYAGLDGIEKKTISILSIGKLVINQSGTRFFLPIYELNTYKRYLITENSIENNDFSVFYSSLGYVPTQTFIGNDLIQIAYDPENITEAGGSIDLQVFRNDELIFNYKVLPHNPASGPVRGLYSYENHWYLETADVLIRDGVVLNEETKAGEMFTFHFLNEKPFYFYRQEKDIHIFYDGNTLPITYQRVIHEPMCCSGGMVNMTLAYNALGFYALRDGSWYYVVITPVVP
jgi:hypothetical protein